MFFQVGITLDREGLGIENVCVFPLNWRKKTATPIIQGQKHGVMQDWLGVLDCVYRNLWDFFEPKKMWGSECPQTIATGMLIF